MWKELCIPQVDTWERHIWVNHFISSFFLFKFFLQNNDLMLTLCFLGREGECWVDPRRETFEQTSPKEFGTWNGQFSPTPTWIQLIAPDICKGSTTVCSRLWRESLLRLAHLLEKVYHSDFSRQLFLVFLNPGPAPLLPLTCRAFSFSSASFASCSLRRFASSTYWEFHVLV